MNKKKILYIAIIVICLSIISGSSLAYFTYSDTATNVITSGKVVVRVVEQQVENGVVGPYPNEPVSVMPGTSISKIVSAQSLAQSAWLRMNYSITVYDADDNKMELSEEALAELISIKRHSTNWTYKDGWWYYSTALQGGEISEALFDSVEFSGPEMGNKYQKATIIIDVNIQAVQKANNGSTVMEAIWPEV